MTTYLYTLSDPRIPDEPRYVGKTVKPPDGAEQEVLLIAQLRGLCKLLNGTDGGEGPKGMNAESRAKAVRSRAWYKHSDEVKQRISDAKKGKPLHPNTIAAVTRPKSPEHVEKIAAARRGKPVSPEARAKLSSALKQAYVTGRKAVSQNSRDRFTTLNKSRAGGTLSVAHKAKVGEASRKVVRTEEWKKSISDAIKKHWETRRLA